MEGTFMDKMNARDSALLQWERAFEKGSILRLRKSESPGFGMIEAIEPEAELFAVAEQVDLAEKAGCLVQTMPNSAKCARMALIRLLRWRISKSRVRCSIRTAC